MSTSRAVEASSFDRVVVIFNPHSTGKAPQMAEQLRADLSDVLLVYRAARWAGEDPC